MTRLDFFVLICFLFQYSIDLVGKKDVSLNSRSFRLYHLVFLLLLLTNIDDILFIDHDDSEAIEYFEKEKSHENESLTASVSDNTFYDTDGASNYCRDKLKSACTQQCKTLASTLSLPSPPLPPPLLPLANAVGGVCEHDAQINFISDWASTGDDTSFYDDRSGALRSVVGHFRSITPHKSSRGAYLHFETNQLKHFI